MADVGAPDDGDHPGRACAPRGLSRDDPLPPQLTLVKRCDAFQTQLQNVTEFVLGAAFCWRLCRPRG